MSFTAKNMNKISAMLIKWALRMKKIPYSYRVKLLSSDNVKHEKIRGAKKIPTRIAFEY